MIHTRRILLMATLLGLLVLTPTRTSAATLVPFHATVFEHFTVSVCAPSTVCIEATGSGHASHMGDVTEYASVRDDINPSDIVNGCTPETRSTVLVADSGSEITMSATGWSCSATSTARDSYVVTGGTGRFLGAVGSGTDDNAYFITGPGTGIAVTTFSGNISSRGWLVSSRRG